jgi:ammonium transporter, Amt family
MSKLVVKGSRGRGNRRSAVQGSSMPLVSSLQKKVRKIALLSPSWQACIPLAVLILLVGGMAASAQDAPPSVEEVAADLRVGLDTMWVMIAAMLVFFMNAGFCMLETGFCRQKNAVNILTKNLIVFAMSTIAYWVIGFGLMFGNGTPFMGLEGLFFLSGADNSPATLDAYQGAYSALSWTGVPLLAKFFFQLVFAGTAATIVSGAVAERIKFAARWICLPDYWTLDLGRRLAGNPGLLGFCWLYGGTRRWRLGGAHGCCILGATAWQIQQRW